MNSDLIDRSTARDIAREFLGQPYPTEDYSFEIMDEHIIERPLCFVFIYESSKFLETGKFEDRLAGNAPILVDRENGAPQWLGTALEVGRYIKAFENEKTKKIK